MCGIYAVTGKTNTFDFIKSLSKLEYRGYDSCGLSYIFKNKVFTHKVIGNTSNLNKVVDKRCPSIILGHTRWATHGIVNPINSHPHTTKNKRFYIVHNGVIDNYLDLKNKYNFDFISNTDSEIIAHLLDMYIINMDIISAIKQINLELNGSYAVVILDRENPNTLYFIKNKNPLLLAKDKYKTVLASDQIAFDSNMNVTILNDNNYGYITKNNYQIYTLNQNEKWNTFYKDISSNIKKSNKFYMLDEILYQPKMINEIALNYLNIDTKEFNELISTKNEIVFVGAGSSYYASMLLSKYYERKLKKRCFSIIASELKYFELLNKDILFIFLSQSGETLDLTEGLSYLKEKKYTVLSLCNNINSTLGYNSDIIFPLFAKEEIAVASTKALTAMLMVGKILINKEVIIKKSNWISNCVALAISRWNEIDLIANIISKYNNIFFIGKDIDYYISLEASLKLREISYLNSFAFQSGELKHGSIALIDEGCICIGILTNKEREQILKSNLEEVKSRGARVFLISNCCDSDFTLEGDEISVIVLFQILAYQTASILNRNIDQPRNLAKSVTVL